MTTPTSFPPAARLRVAAEFQATFAQGRRLSGTGFRLHVHLSESATLARLGITVSRRVDKTAVGRNRIKRQARECFRKLRADLPPGDYVLLAKPEAAKVDNARLRAELQTLFERARSLKPTPAPGTMPGSAAIPGRPSPPES